MSSVRQVEVNYPRDQIGVEGSVISKTQGIRHFQKLNKDLIVVAVNKFKMNWETMQIECCFTVKAKYEDNTVSRERFLELMATNSNLMRDLDTANEKIAELEKIWAEDDLAKDDNGMFKACDDEQLACCAAEYTRRCEHEPEMDDSGRGDRAEEAVIQQDVDCSPDKGETADGIILDEFAKTEVKHDSKGKVTEVCGSSIVKHNEEFAKTQEALEITKEETPDGE
jgi:hypothetical protein